MHKFTPSTDLHCRNQSYQGGYSCDPPCQACGGDPENLRTLSDGELARRGTRLCLSARELGAPPVPRSAGDLSRIRTIERDSPEGRELLRRREQRRMTQAQQAGDLESVERCAAMLRDLAVQK